MERVTTDRRLSITQQLVVDLTQQILAGELPAGSKLPTEQVIIKERGVSRTVVRGAMSRLQAEGLVETRHGVRINLCADYQTAFASRLAPTR